MITENLSTLKIHKLTKAQYDREANAGNLEETSIYLTPDEATVIPVEGGGTGATSASDALTNLNAIYGIFDENKGCYYRPTDSGENAWIETPYDASAPKSYRTSKMFCGKPVYCFETIVDWELTSDVQTSKTIMVPNVDGGQEHNYRDPCVVNLDAAIVKMSSTGRVSDTYPNGWYVPSDDRYFRVYVNISLGNTFSLKPIVKLSGSFEGSTPLKLVAKVEYIYLS